jgi:hypothetical protein
MMLHNEMIYEQSRPCCLTIVMVKSSVHDVPSENDENSHDASNSHMSFGRLKASSSHLNVMELASKHCVP